MTSYSEVKNFVRFLMIFSISYGFLIIVFVRLIFGDVLENPAYFPDSYNYLSYATKKVAEWHGEGALGYIPLNTRGYTYFIAFIYSIFGQNIYAVVFVQLLLASLIPIFTFLIAHEFFNIKTAKLSALLVALFPDFYVWASFALKEVIAVFLICLAVLQLLKFRNHPNLINFLFTIIPVGSLLFIRPHIALFLELIFMFALIWPVTIKRLVWLLIAAIIFAILISQAGLSDFVIVFARPLPIYNRGEILVTGTLPNLLKMIISGQLLSNFLLGVGRYFISPLPWQATNAYQAVIPGIVLWYFVLPAAIWGTIGAIRARKSIYVLLLIVLFLIFWYGLISTGTDPRWRLMSVPFMYILSAYGFQLCAKSLLGAIIWIFGESTIWLLLLIYILGIKFMLLMLMPILLIGALLSLNIFRQRANMSVGL